MKIIFLPSKSLVHSIIFQLWFIAINFCFKIHKTKIAAQEKACIHKEAMVDISLGCVCVRLGGELLPYLRGCPPPKIWFLSRFGMKMGGDFNHFGLKFYKQK